MLRKILKFKQVIINNQSRNFQMDLKSVIKRIEEYGNSKIACDWDNVGLLVEPSGSLNINRILLTNDLTEPVLEEAINKKSKSNHILSSGYFWPIKTFNSI